MKIRGNRMLGHLYKKIVSGIVVGSLVFGVTLSYQDVCYAEPDASVEQARQDREEAAQLRDQAQRELNNLTSIRDGLKDKIIELDLSITKMQAQITELEMDQKKLEESIKATQADLKEAQEAEEQQYNLMKQRIQMVYESGNKGYLDVLLTATSMTDVMNKMEYTSQVSLYDYNLLTGLQDAKSRVAGIKQKLQLDLSTNESLQKKVSSEKENMEGLVEEKNEQMERYEVSIEEQTEELQRYQQAVAEAEAIIAAAEQAALQESIGTAYTGGAFTWPIPGCYDISSYFGERTSPTAGASSNHMGIDIRCGSGVPVVAAASGRVIVATYNYAEGNYVAIDHGGGVVTLYMHNSSLAVSVGQQVNGGDVIAYSGSTGISTGPHLHFGVRVNGSYVDPLSYLQ
ncbi:MAG: murein hydrolase activator EnvC family protein [Lachnospiraceae bacterium]